ncbi:50S ribosomal protein L23 [Geothrix sp. 21YS21S-2]|uniref:50S ribosomal protein L23 n=1 Tax=Geothrix sp. 21YS21S-2 TaxID=3068893 RepID=UPI001EB99B47|nr:50S ribosomal protein L23 [Geothrix sp. 21YS21S-2]NTV72949.1 50S ribosomal protein L23 [Holophaga sp.]
MTKIFEVIRKPLLTEKGQLLREANIQVFEVAVWASKHQIKEAAELLLQAKVKSIRTVKMPSKSKRLGRWMGTTGNKKKAYIELVEATEAAQ